jgi:ABC-type transporter Mla subunit MlaD
LRAIAIFRVVAELYDAPAATNSEFAQANASGENMHSLNVRQIREAVAAAQRFAQKSTLDGCDLSDIEEITSPLTHELERANPNKQTLATYLNSLLRSLRAQPHAKDICAQLDELMKQSGIPTDWQH